MRRSSLFSVCLLWQVSNDPTKLSHDYKLLNNGTCIFWFLFRFRSQHSSSERSRTPRWPSSSPLPSTRPDLRRRAPKPLPSSASTPSRPRSIPRLPRLPSWLLSPPTPPSQRRGGGERRKGGSPGSGPSSQPCVSRHWASPPGTRRQSATAGSFSLPSAAAAAVPPP